jgi:hypothetical protein
MFNLGIVEIPVPAVSVNPSIIMQVCITKFYILVSSRLAEQDLNAADLV